MKKLSVAVAILILLAGIASYNVWRANQEPVVTPLTAVEVGRQQLHAQLEASEHTEAEIEKQDWNSVTLLRDLIKAHQQRIEALSGNTQAGEILAHDRDSIARIEARINDLIAQEASRPAAPDDGAPQSVQAPPDQKQ